MWKEGMLQIHKATPSTGFNPAGVEVLPYIGHIGMWGPKEYDFWAVLVLKRYTFLPFFLNYGKYHFYCGLALGISFTRNCIFCITIGKFVPVRALAGDIVLCTWAKLFTFTVPHSTQVYKWVPANSMLRVTLRWTSISSRGSRNTPSRFMRRKPG